jgi:hypothetical protein
MKKTVLALAFGLAAAPALAQELKVLSDKTVGGLVNPESVAYDAKRKVLYSGEFGSPKLDPALKDGMGRIVKLSLDGKVLDKHFLPAGGEKMNKPKGIWVKGDRLWVTDIDAMWVFDTKTRKGRRLPLPEGVTFANDVAVAGNALYISDNRNDLLLKVEPADFLDAKVEPKITTVFKGEGVNPNGVWPRKAGGVYVAGFVAPDKPRAIYLVGADGKPVAVTDPIGRLDGLYEMKDGSLLATNWDSGSLFHWSKAGGVQKLAEGFKGPADFTVIPGAKGTMTVVVPDLVQSQLRFIRLGK